ncbi:hypothetical protein AB0B50_25575 [Streptomyces sp. NPDC041068]|uniref:hypothetical protein n=1 Tax=Streptomyces sp. NPDC041068 TaxID=3155130 RepID=UPI0033CD8210
MRRGKRGRSTLGTVTAVVLWAAALVAFAVPLRHALVATQAYRAGYWATVTDGRELDDFAWRDPAGRTVRGAIEGVPEDGEWDEEGEGTSDVTGRRVWVSREGAAHIGESAVETDMVIGYGGAGAVVGVVLLALRARHGRRTEGEARDDALSLRALTGR